MFYGRHRAATVKYKKIKGAIHDLGQEFLGSKNFGLGGYVSDLIGQLVKEAPHKLAINFSTCEISPAQELPITLPAAVREYHEQLGERLKKHGVNPDSVENVTMVHAWHDGVHSTQMVAWDDRGKKHSIQVRTPWFT